MSFERNDTYNNVVDVVAKKLSIDKNGITENSSFQDLGADSLDMFEIVTRLEDVFGIEFDDESTEKLTGMREVVDYIHERRVK